MILKVARKGKALRIAEAPEEERGRGSALPDIRAYPKAVGSEPEWYSLVRAGQPDRWEKTEPDTYGY